jgi:hypothetical protein
MVHDNRPLEELGFLSRARGFVRRYSWVRRGMCFEAVLWQSHELRSQCVQDGRVRRLKEYERPG